MEKKVEKEKNKKKKEKKGKQEKKERQLLESETSADQMQITTLSKSLSHQSETEKLDKRLFFESKVNGFKCGYLYFCCKYKINEKSQTPHTHIHTHTHVQTKHTHTHTHTYKYT